MKTKSNASHLEEKSDVIALGSVSRDTKGDGTGVEPSGIGKFPPGVISED